MLSVTRAMVHARARSLRHFLPNGPLSYNSSFRLPSVPPSSQELPAPSKNHTSTLMTNPFRHPNLQFSPLFSKPRRFNPIGPITQRSMLFSFSEPNSIETKDSRGCA
ncbi:hypothetical protein CC2G_006884 [Coprinopsis cinerea AmutBmut pab1-1]|nr:hypothetical protein CC2G_006884 [Coprinopsis cinerea AmutBmut pab1-1]